VATYFAVYRGHECAVTILCANPLYFALAV